MDFVQRSYSGHAFRPRPVIENENSTNSFIVATSWGLPEHGQKVVQILKEQLSQSQEPEATRVGNFVEGLTDENNRLRSAAMIANEQLFRSENAKEYTAAVEVALISVQNRTLHWAQLGNPHLILVTSAGLQPLCYTPDWSWQYQQGVPLVSKALGLERSCYLNCGSYRLQKNEKVLMISRSAIPSELYSLKSGDLNQCAEILVNDHSEAPFWIGMLSL